MSDVQFNPDQGLDLGYRGVRGSSAASGGFITRVAMKLTGIQDEKKINQALIVVIIVCFLISAYVLWTTLF